MKSQALEARNEITEAQTTKNCNRGTALERGNLLKVDWGGGGGCGGEGAGLKLVLFSLNLAINSDAVQITNIYSVRLGVLFFICEHHSETHIFENTDGKSIGLNGSLKQNK